MANKFNSYGLWCKLIGNNQNFYSLMEHSLYNLINLDVKYWSQFFSLFLNDFVTDKLFSLNVYDKLL